MYWTTLEISAPRCALMCYPSSNITYCIACLLCIGVILLNKCYTIGPLGGPHEGDVGLYVRWVTWVGARARARERARARA